MNRNAMVLYVILLLGFMVSCGSKELLVPEEEAYPATFTTIRDRILIPRCVNCHSGIVSHDFLLTDTQKEGPSETPERTVIPGDAEGSSLYKNIKNAKMPAYGQKLSEAEIKAIKKWIDNGAKND